MAFPSDIGNGKDQEAGHDLVALADAAERDFSEHVGMHQGMLAQEQFSGG